MSAETIRTLVIWIPTGLFVLTILIGFLVGLIRGFRKSLILFVHAIVIFAGLAIAYSIIVSNPGTDKSTFDMINGILSGTAGTSIQKMAEVSESCASLKEVISELIVKNAGQGEGLALVLQDNGQYLAMLVNMAYHLVFFVIFYIFYFILIFIMYIVYLIAYPERRYKKKKETKYAKLESRVPYKKRPWLGSLVGTIRGLIAATLSLSVVGIVLYIGYGDGSSKRVEYTFADEQFNNTYSMYDAMSDYGTEGIFKIMNAVKDGDNFPFYLYTANYIISGNYTDENGKTTNIYLAKELGKYSDFANSTMKLVLKYDTDKLISNYIVKVSNKEATTNDLIGALATIMSKSEFQNEFDLIVDNFKGDSTLSNMGLSFLTSVVKYRKELGLEDNMNEDAVKLLEVIFDGDEGLKVSSILTETDTKLLLKSVTRIIAQTAGSYEDDTARYLALAECSIPYITELSILNDETRKSEINPTLERLYNYLASLNTSTEDSTLKNNLDIVEYTNKTYNSNLASSSIDWASELKTLLNASKSAISLFRTVYKADTPVVDCIFNIFTSGNTETTTLQENYYDEVTNALVTSKLFGAAMSISFVKDFIKSALANINKNIVLPSSIQFANVYNDDGTVKTYGEVYYLLTSVKKLLKNDGKSIYTILTSNELKSADLITVLKKLDTEVDGESIFSTLVNSTVIRYIVSGVVLNISDISSNVTLIIPETEVETDSDNNKVLTKATLTDLVSNFSSVLDNIEYVSSSDTAYVNLKGIIAQKDNLLANNILHATIIYYLVQSAGQIEQITIPAVYNDAATKEALTNFSNNVWKTKGEISTLLDVLDDMFGISKSETFNLETALENIGTTALNLNSKSDKDSSLTKLQLAYKSDIIVATLTSTVDKVLTESIIDLDIRDSSIVKDTNDVLGSYYKQSEVASIINSAKELAITSIDVITQESFEKALTSLNDTATTDTTKTKLDVIYSSAVIRHALTKPVDNTLTDTLVSTDLRDSTLVKDTDLTVKYYKKSEVSAIINFLKELEINDLSSINAELLKTKILNLNKAATTDATKSKLDVLYSSNLLVGVLTKQLDNVLITTDPIVPTTIVNSTLVKTSNTVIDYYLEAEVKAIINVANELGITNIESIDVTTVKNQILNLNKAATTDTSVTKLDVLYTSAIIRHALTKPVDEALTTDIVATEVRDSSLIKGTELEVLYYLKTEISSLINALNELGITNIDTIDTATIKAQIFKLNNTSTIDSTKTKLNILYTSNIIANAFTKPLDTALTSDILLTTVRDSDVIKEDVLTIARRYKEDEISSLINALNELGITDIDTINTSTIKAQIFTLNNVSTIDTSKTKLNVLYTSNIIANAFTNPLDTALTSDILLTTVRDSDVIKEDVLTVARRYQEAEIKTLINALNELGITDIDTITADTVKNQILSLNNTSTIDSTKTKLNVLYTSNIIANAFTTPLDNSLTSAILALEVRDSDLVKEDVLTISRRYQETEVAKLINALTELGITNVSNIDTTKIKEEIINVNDAATTDSSVKKIDVLYASVIIKHAITIPMDETVEQLVSSDVMNSDATKATETGLTTKYYLKSEVSAIISSAKELGLTDLTATIELETVKNQILSLNETATTDTSVTKLDVLYSSVIIKYSVAAELDKQFVTGSISVNNEVIDLSKTNVTTIDTTDVTITNEYYYLKVEVARVVSALTADGLGITDINSISSISADSIKSLDTEIPTGENAGKTHLNVVYASYIISDIISSKMNDALDSNTNVVNPASAKETFETTSVKHYKESEILVLIKFLNSVSSSASLNSIDFTSITLDATLKGYILSSDVLYYTVSKNVINNTSIVTPASLVSVSDNPYINDSNELGYLIDAVIVLTGGSISSNASPSLSVAYANVDTICASLIMRATVSDKVTSSSTELYVLDSDVTIVEKYSDSSSMLVFTKDELKNVITSLKLVISGDSYDFNIDLYLFATLTNAQKDTFLTSNTARFVISSLISSNSTLIALYGSPTHADTVYEKISFTATSKTTTVNHYSKEEILAMTIA